MPEMPETALDGTKTAGRALTDLYDERRRTVLVHYPVGLVVALGLTGVFAFGVTGFLDYRGDAPLTREIFHQPWMLFLWFCALIVVLQCSILRHPTLRRQRDITLTATGISMVLVTLLYLYRDHLAELLDNIIQAITGQHIILRLLSSSPWTYALINFTIIAIFSVDTARRWRRRAQGLSPTPQFDIGMDDERTVAVEDMPTLAELISGDLVAGSVLLAVLAVVFRADVVAALVGLAGQNIAISDCTVSLPGAYTLAASGACQTHPATLTFIDSILGLLLLPTGLFVLAVSALLNALAVVGGVNAQKPDRPVSRAQPSSTLSVSDEVTLTLLDALRAALDRGRRQIAPNLLAPLRAVGWPLLVFIGVFGVATTARAIKIYLHNDKLLPQTVSYEVQAAIWGVVAALAIVISAALLLYRGRVATNSMRFLGLIGFVMLLTLWIFSLALWSFNQLLVLIMSNNQGADFQPNDPRWHPFDLGAGTFISFGALLFFGSILVIRRLRALQVRTSTPPA